MKEPVAAHLSGAFWQVAADSGCGGWTKSFFVGNMEQMGIINWLTRALSVLPRDRGAQEMPYEIPLKAPSGAKRAHDLASLQKQTGAESGYATKRRYERFPVAGQKLKAKAALTEVIELSNVSIGGACIITTRTLMPGDNVLLRIPVEKVEKPLKCTIIWEAASNRPLERSGAQVPAYKAGVKFNDVPPSTVVQLKDFMRSTGIPVEGKRDARYEPSPLRFSVLLDEKALMNYSATFPVKKISLGGMLVQTGAELVVEGKYPAALYLPGSERPVRFIGRVASKIPLEEGFDVGMEFCDMSADDRSRLAAFLENLATSV
jgi:hypothetical protein